MNRSQLLCYTLLLVCTIVGVISTPAAAHVLKTDGVIAAVLHIDPNDQPVSGVSTTYILFMDDTTGHFSLSACNCTVTVLEDGRIIATQPVERNPQSIPSGVITFPQPDVYHLIFNGAPLQPGAFQPFTLDYLERVTQGPRNSSFSALSFIWLGAVALIVVVSFVACWLQLKYDKVKGDEI